MASFSERRSTVPRSARLLVALCVAVVVLLHTSSPAHGRWVGAWGAAHTGAWPVGFLMAQEPFEAKGVVRDRTIRMFVRPTADGDRVRVLLSNAFGTTSARIGHATIAPRTGPERVGPGVSLTVAGSRSFVLQPGQRVLSDPVALQVSRGQELAISLHVVSARRPSWHPSTWFPTFMTAPGSGDVTESLEDPRLVYSGSGAFLISRIDVENAKARAVVIMGTSMSDGAGSNFGSPNTWFYGVLYRAALREAARPGVVRSFVNASNASGELTRTTRTGGPAATKRLVTDALAVPGVGYVVFELGSNDVGLLSRDRIVAELRELVRRSRRAGVKVTLATITPRNFVPQLDRRRLAVNRWIRAQRQASVVDFDKLLRDPEDRSRLRPDLDADTVHPNQKGHTELGRSFPLAALGVTDR